jgi:hypothetical protein
MKERLASGSWTKLTHSIQMKSHISMGLFIKFPNFVLNIQFILCKLNDSDLGTTISELQLSDIT